LSDGLQAKARPDTPTSLTFASRLYTSRAGVAINQIQRVADQEREERATGNGRLPGEPAVVYVFGVVPP